MRTYYRFIIIHTGSSRITATRNIPKKIPGGVMTSDGRKYIGSDIRVIKNNKDYDYGREVEIK